ncbi:MAG TPA: Rieske 2Fe-2S domain-containing protein [Chloroflexota bacterium]|jgi:nitrite reductase/ring-hydroxylating ferredoxin subunit
MLTLEDNEFLTRVGPGTPAGNLMRQYWVPALLSSELPEPDCTPVRVLLLDEKLIAFRDSNGQVGLIANHCPHRGASLFFGRNEECGLRCVYHGWKFDVTGRCVDMPNEPPESNFKDKIEAVAYPCRERGGVVWTYMGPRATPPPLPDLEANMLPDGECMANAVQRECNWLQGLEGEIDTSHFSFLHLGGLKVEDVPPGTFQRYLLTDRAPRFAVVDTEYGAMYGAYRAAHDGLDYWRIAQFLLPFYAMIPPGVLGLQRVVRAWVPMDDTHMMFFSMASMDTYARLGGGPRLKASGASPWQLLPNTTDWYGRFRLAANAGNDYLIDREKQHSGEEFTGITGVHAQDQAITESMGSIYDRCNEHLGAADVMVIRARRRLLDAARALAEKGSTPPGVDNPEVYRVRSGGVFLPHGADWVEATKELRKALVDHPELDPAVSGGA